MEEGRRGFVAAERRGAGPRGRREAERERESEREAVFSAGFFFSLFIFIRGFLFSCAAAANGGSRRVAYVRDRCGARDVTGSVGTGAYYVWEYLYLLRHIF